MRIKNTKYGDLELEIQVAPSTVDSYILSGWSITYGYHLNDSQLDYLQEKYNAEIQQYAWENGSVNHN